MSKVLVKITSVTRANNSHSGNPTFNLHTDDATYRTEADAACAYDVQNDERVFSAPGVSTELELTRNGRVARYTLVYDAAALANQFLQWLNDPNGYHGSFRTSPYWALVPGTLTTVHRNGIERVEADEPGTRADVVSDWFEDSTTYRFHNTVPVLVFEWLEAHPEAFTP